MTSCETQMSARAMAIRLGVARSTVQDCLRRIAAAGLTWPVPDDLTDDVLERNTNLR
jgi:transposase